MEDLTLADILCETASDWSASERKSRASLRSPGTASLQQGVSAKTTQSDACAPSPQRSRAYFVSALTPTPPGSPSLRSAVAMAAGMYLPNELPITFDGQPHIMTDLNPNTTCTDLIHALLRYRAVVQPATLASPVSLCCLPPASECDIYVVRQGERKRKINRGVRIQTFYRHYVQRHAADTFYLEVCRREGVSTLTRRRNLNVCHACGNEDRPASPDASRVEFFDAEAARKAKEDAETRRQLLKTIDRQAQDLERLRIRLREVESEISQVEWKILPSNNLGECLAHYERLHRCNRRLLAEHAKICELTSLVEAARSNHMSGRHQEEEELAPLRRTLSASSVMDLAELAIPPPKAFDDCPMAPTYVNFPLRRPQTPSGPSQLRHRNFHGSQPLQNCHQPIRSHGSSKPPPIRPTSLEPPTGGADSDTGLGSLSDEAGCIGPVETLV